MKNIVKYNKFIEKAKLLDWVEISEDIKDLFQKYEDDYDLSLNIFAGYTGEHFGSLRYIFPIWDILNSEDISPSYWDFKLDNLIIQIRDKNIMDIILFREDGTENPEVYEAIQILQKHRDNFLEELNAFFDLRIKLSLSLEYSGTWIMEEEHPTGFMIAFEYIKKK